jgi:hypothetical protein
LTQRVRGTSTRGAARRADADEATSVFDARGVADAKALEDAQHDDGERGAHACSTNPRARKRSSFAAARRAASSAVNNKRTSTRPGAAQRRFDDAAAAAQQPHDEDACFREAASATEDAARRRAAVVAASAARRRSRASRRSEREARCPSRSTTIAGSARKASPSAPMTSSEISERTNRPCPSRSRTRVVVSTATSFGAADATFADAHRFVRADTARWRTRGQQRRRSAGPRQPHFKKPQHFPLPEPGF